jgi:hypothetical protein
MFGGVLAFENNAHSEIVDGTFVKPGGKWCVGEERRAARIIRECYHYWKNVQESHDSEV